MFRYLLLGLLISNVSIADDSFSFGRIDNKAHVLGSYIITYTLSDFLMNKCNTSKTNAIVISSVISLGIGILKETLIDSKISKSDLIADSIGTGLGAITFYTIHF